MAFSVSGVTAAVRHLIAWIKAAALSVVSLKLLVMIPILYIANMLPSFKTKQKSKPQPVQEPRLLFFGTTGIVYQISDAVVVKKCLPEQNDELTHEQSIFAKINSQPLSPYIVQHFYDTQDAIFMEYMPGTCLAMHLSDQLIRDDGPGMRVLRVEQLPAERDCLRWMRQVSAAAAWLEELGLAHCDIRPGNILLSSAGNVKLADFGRTCKIGNLEVLTQPFARRLGGDPKLLEPEEYEEHTSMGFTYGKVGCRTEQFAIGSTLYVLTRGYSPYENEYWGSEHHSILSRKLQDMELPVLNSQDKFDAVIENCWHGRYESIAQLSRLLAGMDQYSSGNIDEQPLSAAELELRKRECMDMVQSGVLEKLVNPFEEYEE